MKRRMAFVFFCICLAGSYAQKTYDNDSILPSSPGFQKESAKVTINEDSRIKKLLAIKTAMDKKGSLSDNYRIQLYYGTNNEAQKILEKAQEEFPQWEASIIWETPNFKVWLGNYRSKLEVDRALKEVKKTFNTAFSFKPE